MHTGCRVLKLTMLLLSLPVRRNEELYESRRMGAKENEKNNGFGILDVHMEENLKFSHVKGF